jgi:hypothetical protein
VTSDLQNALEFSNGILDMLEGWPGGGKILIQLHATLDDVGTCANDGMCAVVGYVAYSEDWKKFNWRWQMTLEQLGMKEGLHTAKYLNNFPLVGGNITDEDVCLILAPFVEAVKGTLLAAGAVPICVITDCDAYEQLNAKQKKFVRPPSEHSFEVAVLHSIRALRNPLNIDDAVSVQMDESPDVPRLYSRYQWLKEHDEDAKRHLGAICFMDDKRHLSVQAADMLGNILLKTWRIAGTDKPLPHSLREVTFNGDKPRLQLIHFDVHNLRVLAQTRMQSGNKLALPEAFNK